MDARFSEAAARPTSWAAVTEALSEAEIYWLSTTRADGAPHVTPLIGVWLDAALWFCTGPAEQKARNLEAHGRCALTTGRNDLRSGLDVVLEGSAERVADEQSLARAAAAYVAKYGTDWAYDVHDGAFVDPGGGGAALVFRVAPAKILAFAKDPYAQTRWSFG
jgi:nitroimidazol reductase NimA-like FMN-containing flavoprotein (pyridoxamine 5'-phosphate oxidase superfamily)